MSYGGGSGLPGDAIELPTELMMTLGTCLDSVVLQKVGWVAEQSKIYMIDSWMIMAKESWSHRHNSRTPPLNLQFLHHKSWLFIAINWRLDGPDAIG